jgi:uncharacterized protein (UPF0332 family)
VTRDAQAEIIREELELGDRALAAAEALRNLKLLHDALSRLYFAAFHWARALLASEGYEAKSHHGVQSLLGQHFIRTGRLGAEHQHTLGRLETWRGKADYTRGFIADEALFDLEVTAAKALRDAATKLLASMQP